MHVIARNIFKNYIAYLRQRWNKMNIKFRLLWIQYNLSHVNIVIVFYCTINASDNSMQNYHYALYRQENFNRLVQTLKLLNYFSTDTCVPIDIHLFIWRMNLLLGWLHQHHFLYQLVFLDFELYWIIFGSIVHMLATPRIN